MKTILTLTLLALVGFALSGCAGSGKRPESTTSKSQPTNQNSSAPERSQTARLSNSDVRKTIADWRAHVGHWEKLGKPLKLSRLAASEARAAHVRILRRDVFYGSAGAAVYLDLVTRDPVQTLRRAEPLIHTLAARGGSYPGGWAVRLRNAHGITVWTAGNYPSGGFVGSRTQAVDAVSPVSHG